MWLTFKSIDLSKGDDPSIMWVSLIWSIEDLKKEDYSSEKERILPPAYFWIQMLLSTLPWVSSLLCRIQICQPITTCMSACSVAQSCPTLCDPMDCSLAGSSVHGIFQARILEQVTISYSRGSSWPRDLTWISEVSCISRQILCHCTTWEAPIRC